MKFISPNDYDEEKFPVWLKHDCPVMSSLGFWNKFIIDKELFDEEEKENTLDMKDILYFLGFETIQFLG